MIPGIQGLPAARPPTSPPPQGALCNPRQEGKKFPNFTLRENPRATLMCNLYRNWSSQTPFTGSTPALKSCSVSSLPWPRWGTWNKKSARTDNLWFMAPSQICSCTPNQHPKPEHCPGTPPQTPQALPAAQERGSCRVGKGKDAARTITHCHTHTEHPRETENYTPSDLLDMETHKSFFQEKVSCQAIFSISFIYCFPFAL